MGLITIPWSSVGDNIAMMDAIRAAREAEKATGPAVEPENSLRVDSSAEPSRTPRSIPLDPLG